MAWLCIIIGGLMETVWAIGLQRSEGFTRIWLSTWTVAAMLLSVFLLAQGLRTVPVGTGYAVWTGIGAVGTALVGMLFLGEPRSMVRILCILLIVAGIVGLKLFS